MILGDIGLHKGYTALIQPESFENPMEETIENQVETAIKSLGSWVIWGFVRKKEGGGVRDPVDILGLRGDHLGPY